MAHSDTKSTARLGANLAGSQRPLRQASHVPGYIAYLDRVFRPHAGATGGRDTC